MPFDHDFSITIQCKQIFISFFIIFLPLKHHHDFGIYNGCCIFSFACVIVTTMGGDDDDEVATATDFDFDVDFDSDFAVATVAM